MPWTKKDVVSHKARLSDKQEGAWVKIANETLADCLADDGDQSECEGKAIRIANAAVEKVEEAGEMAEAKMKTVDMEAPSSQAEVDDLARAATLVKALREIDAAGDDDRAVGIAVATLVKALREIGAGLESFSSQVRSAFYAVFEKQRYSTDIQPRGPNMWVKDIFVEHPDLGDAVVVDKDGALLAVSYSQDGEGAFTFAAPEEWERVMQTYVKVDTPAATEEGEGEPGATQTYSVLSTTSSRAQPNTIMAAELSERANFSEVSRGRAVNFIEAEGDAPAYIDLIPVSPGWGNKKQNHYYDLPVLEEFAGAWQGAKMWASDHRPEEKNALNQISEVVESPVGHTDDGVPIARAVILSAEFEDVVRRRAAAGILHTLENSILAAGTVRKKPYEKDGRKGKYVESIESEGAVIDWVTKGGAGGHAQALAETEEGGNMSENEQDQQTEVEESVTEETEVVTLAEADVTRIVEASGLPKAAKERLAGKPYENEQAVTGAVAAEVAYLKEITGSGRVTGQGPSTAPAEQRLSEADLQDRLDDVDRRHGLYVKEGV